MQPTTCFYDGITNAILQEADFIFHHPVAFHPTNGVLNTDSDGGNTALDRFLRRSKLSSRRCFLRLKDRDTMQDKSLEALILIQATAGWQGIARFLCQTLIRRFAFTGVA
jgi:hypothetical protein